MLRVKDSQNQRIWRQKTKQVAVGKIKFNERRCWKINNEAEVHKL